MSWELRLGDCLDPETGLASLADKSIDHFITDPPYSEHVHGNARTNRFVPGKADSAKAVKIDFDHLGADTRVFCGQHFARLCRRWTAVFCEVEGVGEWITDLTVGDLEYIRTGFWVRVGSMPQISGDRPAAGAEPIVLAHPSGKKRWNGGGKAGVWTFNLAGKGGDRHHPTEKPTPLMDALIRDFTDPGDLVCDPFAGSGSTGVAAVRLGRRFIGWERDPKYHAIAMKRLLAAREQIDLFSASVKRKPKQFTIGGDHGKAEKEVDGIADLEEEGSVSVGLLGQRGGAAKPDCKGEESRQIAIGDRSGVAGSEPPDRDREEGDPFEETDDHTDEDHEEFGASDRGW